MRAGMKADRRLQKMFGALVAEAEKRCDAAKTLRSLNDCEDEVERVFYDFNRAL